MQDDNALFWSRVDVRGPDACWLWGFACDTGGFGIVKWDGRNDKAHRVAFALAKGPVPPGLYVLHSCDVRNCCNPAHLSLGTAADNVADMMRKCRYKAVGESHRRSLPPERRRELREAWLVVRFWAKVDRCGSDECWEWQGGLNDKGYGSVGFRGKAVGAHRAAYELLVGPIPPGMCLLHACDNRRCVNPAHLSVGTRADNNADMFRKGRQVQGDMPKGSRHHNARLTESQVREIRAAYASGVMQKTLCARFGVGPGVVCEIVNRKAWVHVA